MVRHATLPTTAWLCCGLFTLILGSGCTLLREPLPPVHNPVPALQEVALIPVGAHDADASLQWTHQLHDALLHVEGIQRVHVVPASASTDTEELLKSSHRCLLEINVIDFDAYYPPRALVEVHFYVLRVRPPRVVGILYCSSEEGLRRETTGTKIADRGFDSRRATTSTTTPPCSPCGAMRAARETTTVGSIPWTESSWFPIDSLTLSSTKRCANASHA